MKKTKKNLAFDGNVTLQKRVFEENEMCVTIETRVGIIQHSEVLNLSNFITLFIFLNQSKTV